MLINRGLIMKEMHKYTEKEWEKIKVQMDLVMLNLVELEDIGPFVPLLTILDILGVFLNFTRKYQFKNDIKGFRGALKIFNEDFEEETGCKIIMIKQR